jgi:signal transduction histidine kinase
MKDENLRNSNQKIMLEKHNKRLEERNAELMDARIQISDAQEHLVQSENLATVGQLTAAISHEIQTPIQTIYRIVDQQNEWMKSFRNTIESENDQEQKYLLQQMEEAGSLNILACERIQSILKSLNSFSQGEKEEQKADINEIIQSVVLLTSNLWKRRIVLEESYDELPMLACDPGMISQIVMNLMVNSIHSIPEQGKIVIRTWVEENNIFFSIKDTGIGIPEENLKRIFEVGFTTKQAGLGSGLGLSIIMDIIKKYKGNLAVLSKVSEGSTFTVQLPLRN